MNSVLLGIWFFTNIIYRGELKPRPNPNLIMTIHFEDTTTNSIRYYRENESGFCERKASYEFKSNILKQKVTWVNPENMPSCSADPDMMMGKESSTKLEASDGQLLLHLAIGPEELIYVWERQLN